MATSARTDSYAVGFYEFSTVCTLSRLNRALLTVP